MFDPLKVAESAGWSRGFYTAKRWNTAEAGLGAFAKPSRRKKVAAGLAERMSLLREWLNNGGIKSSDVETLANILYLQEMLKNAPGLLPEVCAAWDLGYKKGSEAGAHRS